MLQQSSLESQLFVGLGELSRSFRDPPIDFICDQIIHAALKAFDFLGRILEARFHVRPPRMNYSDETGAREIHAGIRQAAQRMDFVAGSRR